MKDRHQSQEAIACNMAIHACLAALSHQLAGAKTLTNEAFMAIAEHKTNLAIGTILPLERTLPECEGLLRAVLTLQQWRNRMPAKGGAA